MRALATIAQLTFREARRRRTLAAALGLGVVFLAVFGAGLHFLDSDLTRRAPRVPTREMFLDFVVMTALYATNFLIVMTAVLTPIETVAGEISSGAIQSLATKAIRRDVLLFGKWLGCWLLVVGYAVFMCGGVLLVARLVARFTPPGIAVGVPLMLLEATLLMTVSLAVGTRLDAPATGVTGFGLYGIALAGGWMEQAGTMVGNATARYLGIAASLLVPSESLWQLAAFHMQPPIMREVNLTPFSPASVPSLVMVGWAAVYTAAALVAALVSFRRREL